MKIRIVGEPDPIAPQGIERKQRKPLDFEKLSSELKTQGIKTFNDVPNGMFRRCKVDIKMIKNEDMLEPIESEEPDIGLRWFGPSWGAPLCSEDRQSPAPVGQPCFRCAKPIQANTSGILMWHMEEDPNEDSYKPYHRECALQRINK